VRVLIVGGSGYVGPVVARTLLAHFDDMSLSGLDCGWFADQCDGHEPLPEILYEDFKYMDARDMEESHLSGVDAVVYLAAISNDPMGNRFRDLTFEINRRQATRTAQMAKAGGATKFIFASSASVYGRGTGQRTESDPLDPQTAYAESKILAERDLKTLADGNFEVSCLRFATACGWSPRVRLDLVLNDFVASALTAGRIEVLSDGSPWRPLIHVADMSRAVAWAISDARRHHPDFVSVNVGSSEWNFQIRDLADAVADVLGGVDVSINHHAAADTRSYQLDFANWERMAPNHQPQVSLECAIRELAENLSFVPGLDSSFRDSPRVRLRRLETLLDRGALNSDLRWVSA
jgi:nucleoside-diphosphate-sugar epimerase